MSYGACSQCSWLMLFADQHVASVDRCYPVLRPSYGDPSQSSSRSLASTTNLAESPRKPTQTRFVSLVVDTAGEPTGVLFYCRKVRWASGGLDGCRQCRLDSRMWLLGAWLVAPYTVSVRPLCSTSFATSPSRPTHARSSSPKSRHARSFRPTPHFLLSHRRHPLLCRLVAARVSCRYIVVGTMENAVREIPCKQWVRGEACGSCGDISNTDRYAIRFRLRAPFFNLMSRTGSSHLRWQMKQS